MSDYDLSRPVVARVREAADIVAVIGEVVTLKKSGRSFMGLCPFHGEKTPSFSVSREKGTYYCFGCKRGGDAIDFVMELERLSFAETVERLAERFGVELPLASPESRRRRDEQASLTEVVEAAQGFFSHHLGEDRPRAFLERRGVPLEFAAGFGLGYAPAAWRDLYDTLHRRFSEASLLGAGLVVQGEQGRLWDRFRDRVTIPIRLPQGRLVAFGGRAVGDDTPKYLNSPETPLFSKSHVLFALDRAARVFARANQAVVVEGYFDCLALHQAGIDETVATLGTALSEHHARELARKVPKVAICFDGDAAGRTAAVAALRTLLAVNLEVSVLLLPEGQDPDDVVRREGGGGFRRLLEGALTPTDFLLRQLGRTRGERRRNAGDALATLNACPDPVRRFLLKESLAYAAGLDLASLGEAQAPRVVAAAEPATSLPPPGEAAILRALLIDLPLEQRGPALAALPLEAVDHPVTRVLLLRLRERAGRGEPLEISGLEPDIEEREVRRVLAALEHEVPPTNGEHLSLIMRELCEKHLQRRLAALSQEIQQAEKHGEQERIEQLLREKQALIRKASSP